jgi:hypothetical protein
MAKGKIQQILQEKLEQKKKMEKSILSLINSKEYLRRPR